MINLQSVHARHGSGREGSCFLSVFPSSKGTLVAGKTFIGVGSENSISANKKETQT